MGFNPIKDHAQVRVSAAPPEFALSPQQEDILDWVQHGSGNAIIKAVAGSGKTTTLIEVCKYLSGSVAFAAFNKKIASEIGLKLQRVGLDTHQIQAATFHSFGFRAWKQAAPRVKMDGDKVRTLLKHSECPYNLRPFVTFLVSLAKHRGIGVLVPINDLNVWDDIVFHFDAEDKIWISEDGPSDWAELVGTGIEWSQHILARSNEIAEEVIDFDDMIYIPLLREPRIWKYDWVLVDEAQDTNPTRLALADMMLRPGGRLIAVGDPRQAIYGFTGADHNSIDEIQRNFNTISLPLTVSHRCSQEVVRRAQEWAPEIEAAPDAPLGSVTTITGSSFRKVQPTHEDAILCRVTKPLIQLALDYLRRRIPAHVEGRDIGQSLITLVQKWKSVQTIDELAVKLDDYLERETIRLIEKGKEGRLQTITDRVESLRVLMESLPGDAPIQRLEESILTLFKDTEGQPIKSVTLSTVHKAKGREWKRVFIFGRDIFMPSKFARQAWQLRQEHNLIYVAVTRAERDLVEVSLAGSFSDNEERDGA